MAAVLRPVRTPHMTDALIILVGLSQLAFGFWLGWNWRRT